MTAVATESAESEAHSGGECVATHDDIRELRDLIREVERQHAESLQRLHGRLDDILHRLEIIGRIEERAAALRADVERHEARIDDQDEQIAVLRERAAWAAKIGAGGAAAGGGSIVLAIVRSLMS